MKTHFLSKKVFESRGWDWDTEEAKQMHRDVTAVLELHFSEFGLDRFQGMTDMLLSSYQVALAEMWCREDEQEKLAKLKHQIRKLSEAYASIHWLIQSELRLNATLPLKTVNGAYVPSEEHEQTSVESDQHPPFLAMGALLTLNENFEDLFPAIEMTSRNMHEGIKYKKRAYEAWRLVEAAADLCRAYPNTINVPKGLNPTCRFRKLLADLFEYFEIEVTPEGAFKGWYTNVDSIREKLDLLPIY